jgi:hypothetical protein
MCWGCQDSNTSTHPSTSGSFNSRRYADESERGPGLGGETSTGCRDIGFASGAHETDDKIAQGRHDLRNAAIAHLGTILVVGHVAHPPRPIFLNDDPHLTVTAALANLGYSLSDALKQFIVHKTTDNANGAGAKSQTTLMV